MTERNSAGAARQFHCAGGVISLSAQPIISLFKKIIPPLFHNILCLRSIALPTSVYRKIFAKIFKKTLDKTLVRRYNQTVVAKAARFRDEKKRELANPEQSGDAKLQDPTRVASCDVRHSANAAAFLFLSKTKNLAKPEQSGDAKLQDPTRAASCDVRHSANAAVFLFPAPQRNPHYVAEGLPLHRGDPPQTCHPERARSASRRISRSLANTEARRAEVSQT